MAFSDQLQQASWKGVPFAVREGEVKFGRRSAVHEYPLSEDHPVWVEDLGRAGRRYTLVGFLIEDSVIYGGGAVIAQRNALIKASETPGPGQLVHPTLGTLTVSLADPVSAVERWDDGRMFEIRLSFIEAGKRIFPTEATSTGDAVSNAAATADTGASSDFATTAATLPANSSAIPAQAQSVASGFVSQVAALAQDATSAIDMVAALPATLSSSLAGSLGRYAGGATTGFMPNASSSIQNLATPDATVQSLIALGVTNRAVVATAGNALTEAAQAFTVASTSGYASAAQALVASLLAATADPADAVRILTSLANSAGIQQSAATAPWAPAAAMQSAAGDLLRRAAVVSLARASAIYQPSSSNDAYTLRTTVVTLLDREIDVAGDQGNDATFNALRALRGSVTADLTARGAALPSIRQVTFSTTLPAPVIAQMLYRDPTRADELVIEANPAHPAFMPTSMKVLAR